MGVYLSGPSLGPVHTVLWSSRRRPRRRRPRGPYWHNRFRRVSYWALCIWAFEAHFWLLYGIVWLAVWAWRHRKEASSWMSRTLSRSVAFPSRAR